MTRVVAFRWQAGWPSSRWRFCCCWSAGAHAQRITGELSGTVVDARAASSPAPT